MAYEDHFQLIGSMSVSDDGKTIYFGARSPEEAKEAFKEATKNKSPHEIGELSVEGNKIIVRANEDLKAAATKALIAFKQADQLAPYIRIEGPSAIRLALDLETANKTGQQDFDVSLNGLNFRDNSEMGPTLSITDLNKEHQIYKHS